MDQKTSAPVTALASGALTGTSSGPEVIAISADGLLQCVLPPVNNAAIQVFSQTIQSNIAAAYVMDVDRDGQQELIVIMTDRVVRSFRWNQSESRLQPVNKWEVPNQISALSIGESISTLRGAETWLSQLGARFYVCLPFSGKDAVTVTYPDTKEHTVMMMPYRSHFIHIMGTLISNIVIIANQKERVLMNPGWDVVSATTVRLSSFNVVATLDLSGLVLIYGYNERNIKDTEIAPLLRFRSMPNSDKLSASVSGEHLLLGWYFVNT
uniref:Integrin-alpha FG-GAP repeat-containing protein 2 n=1 Tax=Heterorhabditis bacteriophora TaxID=37862 RepID=A0A1I7XUV0_HETBA